MVEFFFGSCVFRSFFIVVICSFAVRFPVVVDRRREREYQIAGKRANGGCIERREKKEARKF